MRSLYVMLEAFNEAPRLIGVVSEENGKYQFEYKLNGKLQEWFLKLKEFPDVTKVYDDAETRKFVNRYVPEKDHMFIELLMESAGLSEYDEWEMLKIFGERKRRQVAYPYLLEEIPEGAIVYE